MAASNKPGATMSSRLMTMKFMQRAAASPSSTASTPDHRSAKRQRLSGHSLSDSPTPAPGSDAEAIQQALAVDEHKRQQAIDREAARRGETKWVLDVKPARTVKPPLVRVISTGYAALDRDVTKHDDESSGDAADDFDIPQAGRRSFGKPPAKPTHSKAGEEDFNSDSENSSEDDEDTRTRTHDRPKDPRQRGQDQRRRGKHEAGITKKRTQAQQQAADRRGKQVNLNKLTSISGAGAGGARGAAPIVCHRCGKNGHIKSQCPLGRK